MHPQLASKATYEIFTFYVRLQFAVCALQAIFGKQTGYDFLEFVFQVNHLKQISFKEIIQHYKKQPQAKTDIFRTVIIAQSEPELAVSQTGDIIEFYNTVFIPTVKPFVLQLGQKKAPLVQ